MATTGVQRRWQHGGGSAPRKQGFAQRSSLMPMTKRWRPRHHDDGDADVDDDNDSDDADDDDDDDDDAMTT